MVTPRILVIAGSDSGGGAGIQADLKAITLLGGHGMTAITAVTAQNTLGVARIAALDPAMVVAQIDAVLDDLGADAIKIGMIGSPAIAHAVAERLERARPSILVFDPVMVATSGATLADEQTIAAFARLMALATVITPNLPELAALAPDGAAALAQRTGAAVLAKGGHGDGAVLADRLYLPDGTRHEWRDRRIDTRHTHGTGCTLASALATGLAHGLSLPRAVMQARAYVRRAILSAPGLGKGHGPLGPGIALGTG